MSFYLLIPAISTLAATGIACWLRARLLARLPLIIGQLIGQMVSRMMQGDDLPTLLRGQNDFERIRPTVEKHIDEFLQHKLGREMPMIGMFIGDKTIQQLKLIFMKELEELFPSVMEVYVQGLGTQMATSLHSKMTARSQTDLRNTLYQSVPQLTRIPQAGACLGLAIGLLQDIACWLAA